MEPMKRGEIWTAALNPSQGSEIGKTRPVVIVSSTTLEWMDTRVVVPFTTWQERFAKRAWMLRVDVTDANGLTNVSGLDASQVRCISTGRLWDRLGVLEPEALTTLEALLRGVLEL